MLEGIGTAAFGTGMAALGATAALLIERLRQRVLEERGPAVNIEALPEEVQAIVGAHLDAAGRINGRPVTMEDVDRLIVRHIQMQARLAHFYDAAAAAEMQNQRALEGRLLNREIERRAGIDTPAPPPLAPAPPEKPSFLRMVRELWDDLRE